MNAESRQLAEAQKSGVVHLRSLTGLRFIAAFAVFYAHVQHFLFPEIRLTPLGGPAVSFFFVLSGFILTYVYEGRLERKGIRRFWFTRWARLWPLHAVCFVIALCFMYTPINDPDGRNSYPSMVAQFLMLHSWFPIEHWFTDFNSVSWSISTELFFYLMFPLLLLGHRRWFPWKVVLTFLACAVVLIGNQMLFNRELQPAWLNATSLVIAFPVTRLAEFALGMATCLFMKRINRPFVNAPAPNRKQYLADSLWELFAIALVVGSWWLIVKLRFANWLHMSPDFGPFVATWVRVSGGLFFYAFLIYIFSSRRGLIGQVMASRPGVWLGEISFAFYLIHQIVIKRLNFMALNDLQFALFSFGIALFASAILYRVIEIPTRNALLKVYDRKPNGFQAWTAGLYQQFTTGMGLMQVSAIVILVGLLLVRPVDEVNVAVCRKITMNTAPGLRNIEFREEARLLGIEAARVERGVRIRMAWSRDRSWSRKRFLHICDQDGNIIGQGPLEETSFQVHDANQHFVDEVVLHKRRLKGAAYIAVGFWSEELACTKVASPAAEMAGCRLKIVDLAELQ